MMRPSQCIECKGFPCTGGKHKRYIVPEVEIKPQKVSIVLVSEAAPPDPEDYYYAGGDSLFQQTTVQAFNDAGIKVTSVRDIVSMGVYLTTAIKCGKTGYGVPAKAIEQCSHLLEQELDLFPYAQAYLLMGDVAIKALNHIATRSGQARVIPAGSTYKIRGPEFRFRGQRIFPSYLQAGPSFFIEKSKRRMIAEDIAAAWGEVFTKR
jgi:hypothetical protein